MASDAQRRTPVASDAIAAIAAGQLSVERARTMLAACKDLRDVGEIRDKAQAIAAYLRAQKASVEAQNDAAEIALRASRRAGELLKEVPKNEGTRYGGDGESPPPTYAEQGIDKKQASRWQKLAEISESDFDEHVDSVRRKNERLTLAGAIRAVSQRDDYDGDTWGTPPEYIAAARTVLGSIDLDPATNPHAQKIVQATRFYTKDDDGLSQPWAGRTWLNPPYSYPLVRHFCERLQNAYDKGTVPAAICLVNASTDAAWFQSMLRRFPACFTAGRISFLQPDGQHAGNRVGQTFFYLGDNPAKFYAVFSAFGIVVSALYYGTSE